MHSVSCKNDQGYCDPTNSTQATIVWFPEKKLDQNVCRNVPGIVNNNKKIKSNQKRNTQVSIQNNYLKHKIQKILDEYEIGFDMKTRTTNGNSDDPKHYKPVSLQKTKDKQ